MPIDPFLLKRKSKLHPTRLLGTGLFRVADLVSKAIYPYLEIPGPEPETTSDDDYVHDDTAVTPRQMGVLCSSVNTVGEDVVGVVVEIGSYRGVTTCKLAQKTQRPVIAIDPFMGYGGAEDDLKLFVDRTSDLKNVSHLRMTSGEAARNWSHGPIAFIFIDAVHDYANTMFDARVWEKHLVPGAYLAMHDIDNRHFAGTHFAAWRMSRKLKVEFRVPGLVVLRKS